MTGSKSESAEAVGAWQAWYEAELAKAERQWIDGFSRRYEAGDDVPSMSSFVALWLAERTAPPRPEASGGYDDDVVCLECGQPLMPMGQVCYACSHPTPQQASASDTSVVGVEGLVERMRHAPSRLWMADLVGQQISVDRMREILTAALAGQSLKNESEQEQQEGHD